MPFILSSEAVMRPESQGALWFHRRSAETLELDLAGLDVLKRILQGKKSWSWRSWRFTHYLLARGFIQRSKRALPAQIQALHTLCKQATNLQSPLRSRVAPEVLQIALTDACPQSCQGCFFSNQSAQPSRYLSPQRFARILQQAREQQIFQIAFGGGEPLMHPRLLDYVHQTRQAGIVPNLTSSGRLLNAEKARALKAAGLGQLQLSLNGASPETHGQTRPHYAQVWQAIEHCQSAQLRWGVNILLTRQNLHELDTLLQQLQTSGVWAVNLIRPKAAQDNVEWLETVQPQSADYRELRQRLHYWQRHGRFLLQSDSSLSFLREAQPEQLYQQGVAGCTAGRRMLSIGVDGKWMPCGHVPGMSEAGELKVIWEQSEYLHAFRQLEDQLQGLCAQCEWRSVCRGCRAVVLAEGRDFNGEDRQCPKHHFI